MTLNMSTQHLRTFGRTCQDMNHMTDKIKMPLPHCIFKLWLLYLCPPLEHWSTNFLLSLSSRFSRCVEFIRARFAVNGNPAQPKSHSQAVEAGRPVLSFRDSFLIFCKFSRFIMNATIGRAH